MKVIEYDMNEVEYVKNVLIQCNRVNCSLLEGGIEEPMMARSLLNDNTHRIQKCISILSNVYESLSEYEV